MKTTYIVSGFMRTGTSMMMAALEAGGLEAVKDGSRDDFNKSHSDDNYKPNIDGLYELDLSKIIKPDFPRQYEGRLIKILSEQINGISPMQYKVVFMLRDPEEIRQSCEAAFNRRIDVTDYQERMQALIRLLRNRKDMEVVVFQYRDVIENPRKYFDMLDFFGWPIDAEMAAAKIDPKLYRFRKELLTPGI